MTPQTCQAIRKGTRCGSYAFNLYKEEIDQGDLCDACYWRALAKDLATILRDASNTARELAEMHDSTEDILRKLEGDS